MSSDDDDYLSDKFLVSAATTASSTSNTYTQRRKEAAKKAQLKNEQNRSKSRRQLELESREEGLSKSLFERAKEEEASGLSSGNKALSIMMKMGFKPGQSLGNTAPQVGGSPEASSSVPLYAATESVDRTASDDAVDRGTPSPPPRPHTKHKTEPLPLQEWTGKKGIGLGKRPHSPTASERLAKMVKMAEDVDHRDFRSRARDDYNNRRAEGRLGPAQLTCRTLDERMGKSFNVLWLNPTNENTYPPGLIDALNLHSSGVTVTIVGEEVVSIQSRLRKQMQADALQPISNTEDDNDDEGSSEGLAAKLNASSVPPADQFSPELLEEATQFLRLQAQDRLFLVLSYLRDKHAYCFWCGVEYEDEEEMQNQCPGSEEDDHD